MLSSFKDQKSFGCGWFFKKRIETAGKYSFRNSKVICPAGPEKVRSVVEVRHPGRLGNHLLEQLPGGGRHLSPLLLQKSSLGSLAAVSYWAISDIFDMINYTRLDACYPEFFMKQLIQFIMVEGGVENQSLPSDGDIFHAMPCHFVPRFRLF